MFVDGLAQQMCFFLEFLQILFVVGVINFYKSASTIPLDETLIFGGVDQFL